jgi:hypothetical protein
LIPGKWQGQPGQDLSFAIGFNEILDRPLGAIAHKTGASEAGEIRAQVCLVGGYFLPVSPCFDAGNPDVYTGVAIGEDADISVIDPLQRPMFAVSGWFDGTLPDGSFSGLTLVSEVTTVPEPSTYVLFTMGTVALGLVRLHNYRFIKMRNSPDNNARPARIAVDGSGMVVTENITSGVEETVDAEVKFDAGA